MPTPRFQTSNKPPATGTFRDDGSFWFEATGKSAIHRWLEELVHRLRREFASPRTAVELIRERPEYRVEPDENLSQWESFDSSDQWSRVWTSTSAGEFVKRGVIGA